MTDPGLAIGWRVKARRIAAAIRSLGGTVEDARKLTDAEWSLADALSRSKPCGGCNGGGHVGAGGLGCITCGGTGRIGVLPDHAPSAETRALVLEYLARPEAPDVDPGEPRDEDVPC